MNGLVVYQSHSFSLQSEEGSVS